ncbi:MAG: VOC family protein [Terracidiphilus sp.]
MQSRDPQSNSAYAVGMIRNRSVLTDTLLPHIVYRDLAGAIEWLTRAFGYVEHYRYGDPLSGSQGQLGNACIMLTASRGGDHRSPAETGFATQSLTVFLEEVEAHCAHAKGTGAVIVEEPHETVYGEFQYAAKDPEGHLWLFSRHARNVSPASWGATIVH